MAIAERVQCVQCGSKGMYVWGRSKTARACENCGFVEERYGHVHDHSVVISTGDTGSESATSTPTTPPDSLRLVAMPKQPS